ncbi:MAG TPA: EamA family transporter [Povalibacter sp.]|nr:EamA family transporter [Povalibacter sp.]
MTKLPRPAVSGSLAIIAAFAAIYVIWGTTYLAIALSIQTLPPFISGALRFLSAGALMYAWLRLRTPRPFAAVNLPAAALCGVLLAGIGNGLVIWAQQGIPSGIAALIVTSMPVTVLILDWAFFSKRAPTRQGLVGTAIALIGVVTIVMHTHAVSGTARPLHLWSMIAAVVGWALGTLWQKRAARTDNVLSFTAAQVLFGGAFQFVLSLLDNEWSGFDFAAVSTTSWLALLYLVVFGSIIGLNCYLWLLTRVAAPKVTTYALVNPVVALILGALILHEEITALTIAATLLVLLGVALVLFQDWKPGSLLQRARASLRTVERTS